MPVIETYLVERVAAARAEQDAAFAACKAGDYAEALQTVRRYSSFVYAITDGRNVKIGKANDVEKRMRTLQCAHASELWIEVVLAAPPSVEKILHAGLHKHLIRGEWYRQHEDIWEAFREVAEAGGWDLYDEPCYSCGQWGAIYDLGCDGGCHGCDLCGDEECMCPEEVAA